MIFKIHLGGNEAGKCLCHCDDAARAAPHMHITNSLQARLHAHCYSPYNLFLMLLMFLPHHGCFCVVLRRNVLDKAGLVSLRSSGHGHSSWVLPFEWDVWGVLGDGTVSDVPSFTCAPCSMQDRAHC